MDGGWTPGTSLSTVPSKVRPLAGFSLLRPSRKGDVRPGPLAAGMAEFPARRRTARAWQLCTYIGGFLVIVDVVNISSEAKIGYFHHIVFSD